MGRRRNIRRGSGGGGGGSGGGSGATYRSILGSLLIAQWHQSQGINLVAGEVGSWVDSIGGRSIAPTGGANRPLYTADGANFKARPVVQCDIVGTRGLRGNFAAFTVGGTRPWLFNVSRARSIPATAGVKRIVDSGVAGFGDNLLTFYRNAVPDWGTDANGGTLVAAAATTNTLQHRWEAGFDPALANVLYFSLDAGAHVTAGAGTIIAQTNIGVGQACFTNGEFSDTNHALLLVCSAYPSLTQIAAVHALAVSEFG